MSEKQKAASKPQQVISFWLLVCMHLTITHMTLPCARRLARSAADLARILDSRSRKGMMYNRIREVFPHWHHTKVRKNIRDVYRWLFESMVDALHFHKTLRAVRPADHIELVNESGALMPATERGLILVTGHFGWWELGSMAMGDMGYPCVAIARKMKNPLLEDYIGRIRRSHGIRQLPKKGALRRCLKAIHSGENIGILIDQDARYNGIFVDFLGKPASTYSSPAQISIATGVPAVFAYCLRKGNTDSYRLIIGDIIYPDRYADREDEIRRITQRLTDNLADLVKKHPDKWLWLHRRWKTYPGKYDSKMNKDRGS